MRLAEPLTQPVIGLAIEVHHDIGPGLLEAVYEQCLCAELRSAGVVFARQVSIPMLCKGEAAGDGCEAEVVVAEELILEIKPVVTIPTVHEMQLRTNLRINDIHVSPSNSWLAKWWKAPGYEGVGFHANATAARAGRHASRARRRDDGDTRTSSPPCCIAQKSLSPTAVNVPREMCHSALAGWADVLFLHSGDITWPHTMC
jgi:GxxExxY protein